MSQYTTFDAIQSHHSHNTKMRSSESDLASEDGDSIPSRQGKLGRRESILGIRNIFGRSNKKEADAASLSKSSSRSSSLRASIAEISPWSHGQPNRSETLIASTPSSPDGLVQERPDPSQRAPTPIVAATRRKPGSTAGCTMPPLSKAYPRAIKHGVLPAPTLSADAILRSHERKSSPVTADTVAMAELAGDVQVSDMDKLKRKLRGDALATHHLQWTSKIYVLLQAGYLLQYPGDGHHDRLPEKVLRLGHSSAAFASDLIPGRHWVLQVSSCTDNDGTPQTESRSLFSKLQFRIPDRRTTANLLMVFEGAEDMKEWIAILRTEIEKMGSNKELADMAAGEKDLDAESSSHGRTLGRPIALKKSISFLHSPNAPLMEEEEEEEEDAAPRPSNVSMAATDCDGGMQDSSLDDVSVTNSIISHDGRQLDSLRESSHRFSYLSSGQRTVMTSTNSSPAGSPVMERFPRLSDADSDAAPSRRTSWQAISPLSDDGRHDTIPEGCPATFVSAPPVRGEALLYASAGGSASGRRASLGKAAPSESDTPSPSGLKGGLSLFPRPSIRRQLGAIRVSRPLSTVEDQPSPKENINIPERPITSHHAGSQPPTPPEDVPSLPREFLMPGSHSSGLEASFTRSLGRRTGLATGLKPAQSAVPSNGPRGRRLSSFSSLRKQAGTSDSPHREAGEGSRPSLSIRVCPNYPSQTHLRRPSVEASETSHLHAALSRAAKRASIVSFCSDKSSSCEMSMSMSLEIPPMPAPPPSKALPPIPQRPSTSGRGKLSRKNSMPHVVEGPPPAPPPTCALPPIPIPRSLR